MNALLSIYTWLEIGTVALVGFFVQLVLAVVTWPFDRRKVVTGRCFRLIGVTASKLTPFWRFGIAWRRAPANPASHRVRQQP